MNHALIHSEPSPVSYICLRTTLSSYQNCSAVGSSLPGLAWREAPHGPSDAKLERGDLRGIFGHNNGVSYNPFLRAAMLLATPFHGTFLCHLRKPLYLVVAIGAVKISLRHCNR